MFSTSFSLSIDKFCKGMRKRQKHEARALLREGLAVMAILLLGFVGERWFCEIGNQLSLGKGNLKIKTRHVENVTRWHSPLPFYVATDR